MILFFDFERLLYGQTIGDIGPAARLAKVLMPYPQVDLVLTRWRIGSMRSVDDVRGELPELGDRINDVAHRPVRSDEQPEREITGTLRRTRQLYWAAVVPNWEAQGYIEQATRSGAPLILCRNGFEMRPRNGCKLLWRVLFAMRSWSAACAAHSVTHWGRPCHADAD